MEGIRITNAVDFFRRFGREVLAAPVGPPKELPRAMPQLAPPPTPAPPARPAQRDHPDRFIMSYGDVDGVVTERRIRVIAVENNGVAIYVRAYCEMRGAERTFRADRILSLRSWPDGRHHSDAEMFFADRVPELQRPDPAHDSVMARVRPSLRALIWIARADREINAEEMELLLDYVSERNAIAGERFAAISWNRNRATAEIDAARPTLAVASGALIKMSPTGRDYALTRTYAERLSAIGGAASNNRRRQLFG